MIGVMIVFGILYIIAFFWNIFTDDNSGRVASVFMLTLSAVIFFAVLLSYENRDIPTAIDVYQGKTTLEITYKDSVRIDSVVVFKNEFKKEMEE